ncbi:hypothetical protein DXG01_010694 [Tephrocybe rancida]|nr:hypothetical protein DXG01_010694 [Tephrocybe rancida]
MGTYTETQKANVTVSFSFFGTAIYMYGSKDVDHGAFNTSLDGHDPRTVNGTAPAPGKYPAGLFINHSLNPGPHTLAIVTQDSSVFDIDFITWTSQISTSKNGTLNRTLVDDTESAFMYYGEAWRWRNDMSEFHDNTGQCLSVLHIHGDAVSLFGSVGPDHGPYTVQLDNQPSTSYSATKVTYKPQTLLFHAGSLSDGNHTVLLTNQGNAAFEVDHAEAVLLHRRQSRRSRGRSIVHVIHETPPSSAVNESTIVSPFTLSEQSNSTSVGTFEKSTEEVHYNNLEFAVATPSVRSFAASTLIGEDGSEIASGMGNRPLRVKVRPLGVIPLV